MRLNNYVDMSNKSLIIAGVICLAVCILTKVLLDNYSNEEEKRSTVVTVLYSIIAGLISGILTLVVIKQVNMHNSSEILTDPFPTL